MFRVSVQEVFGQYCKASLCGASCEQVFSKLGMDYRDYIIQNPKYMRPEELKYLKGDSSKSREILGWKPEYTFSSMLDEMIERWQNEL